MEFEIVFYEGELSMKTQRKKDDLDILKEKALKIDPSLKEAFDKSGQALNIAVKIYELRQKAGLTQKELAEMVGTKQSNIARIEAAQYTSYTLKTLEKISKALQAKVEITIVPQSPPSYK